jgi:pyruvate-ferredoxin/flavodoxin oxidoreductase
MKEVLYVIAGKRLPVVFHIRARAITSQSLNIHCGHNNVMGVAGRGWGVLFERNAQGAGRPNTMRHPSSTCEIGS